MVQRFAVSIGLLGFIASGFVLAPHLTVAQNPPSAATISPLVHADAMAVFHVRLADLWKQDNMKDFRRAFNKAGLQAFAELDAQFAPKPSTLDQLTVVVLPTNLQDLDRQGPSALKFVAILRFTEAFQPKQVVECVLPGAVSKKLGRFNAYVDESNQGCLAFVDEKTLIYSDEKTLSVYLTWVPNPDGPLTKAISAESHQPVVLGVNLLRIPEIRDLSDQIPEEFRPILKAQNLTITASTAKEVKLAMKLNFANADDAQAGEKALRTAAVQARTELAQLKRRTEGQLFAKPEGKGLRPAEQLPEFLFEMLKLSGLNLADEFLAEPPLKQTGSQLELTVELPEWTGHMMTPALLGSGLAIPALQKMRETAGRMTSQTNLKQIMLALHSYHDVNNVFPPAATLDRKGKKLLSWRVTILPYVEGEELYRQFKLDEPWDSDNNKKLIAKMPKVYQDPRKPTTDGRTYYKAFVGKNAGFEWEKGLSMASFTDGLSNTVAVVAGGEPVIWSKPDDIEFDADKPLPDLKKPFGNLVMAIFDGSVRTLSFPAGVDREPLLKLLIQRNDGMVIPNFR